ncbi:box C/D snoRNA protein 1 [Fundulus diaphanus]
MSNVEGEIDSCCPEEEQKVAKRKISLSNCGVCGSEEAKYTCPACFKHTCSLLCVKKHKDDSGCSGVRNKTAFVTLSHFDEMALLSDYRFLEDTGRFADGATRDNLIQAPRTTSKAKKLAAQARKMNITLRFLPVTFTKSKENSTFFLTKDKKFLWHLKLIFPQSSSEYIQRRVSDSQTLIQILTAYIHPTESDPVARQKLKMYVHHPFDHVKVFMKAEGRKANSVRYHQLEVEKSLKDNLSYKTIIEYPVLHVVLRDHWEHYPLKGPAEPVSARAGCATRNASGDQEEEEEEQEEEEVQLPQPIEGETNFCTRAQDTTAEPEPPLQKKAKRGSGEEEQEEGEIVESSDEEEENISRDPCLRKDLPGDDSTCRESAEVTVTEENPVSETGRCDSSALSLAVSEQLLQTAVHQSDDAARGPC